jgi:hypothetical protein
MPRALEEKINNIWIYRLKTRKFKNRKVASVFEKLNTWRLLSRALFEKYKDYFPEAYAGKERLTFNNEFEYFSETSGEYLLLTKDLLSIFTKGRIPIFVGNFPIFVQLKSVPVFWINGGIITLWDFYFQISEIDTMFEEALRFSNKIAVFPRLEFTSFNFIQTYSSKPRRVLSFSSLEEKNPRILEFLKIYLTKNFWIIPETDVKDVNPFCFVFLKDETLLPCTPFRIVFKVIDYDYYKVRTIYLLGTEIKCLEIRISYLNSSGDVRTDLAYFPTKLTTDITIIKGKIYNGLLFSFIDLDKEWIFPMLFSFYEENMHSYEIFQELLLLFFKKRYLESQNLYSIEFKEEDCWNEIEYLGRKLWRMRMLPFAEDAFMRLEKKNIFQLLFSGIYPVLVKSQNKVFFVPPPLGLLNLNEEQLKKFIEWCESESLNSSVHAFTKIGDIIPSFLRYQRLVKDIKRKNLYITYLKEMIRKMRSV